MRKTTFSFLFAGALTLAFGADTKSPWASFKPGSFAKYKTTTAVMGTKTVSEMTQTLVSIDANNAVVETETKTNGVANKSKTTIPLKATAAAPTGAAAPQTKALTMTNETVTAAGKSIACKCYDTTTSANGANATTHSCMSDTVPSGLVKSTMKTSGQVKMETVTELVEFVAK